jgi:hypothetical protein
VPLTSAIALAAIGSGIPSTASNLARGRPLLDSTRAAGTMVVGRSARPTAQLVAGAAAHVAISSFWTTVLWYGLPRRHSIWWGAAGGLVIAALDLGVIGARVPAIRELDLAPQIADHVAFGAIVAWARNR